MSYEKDKEIIRVLAEKTAEIAAMPIHKKRMQEWISHNALKQIRPMFMIDQICWNEMNVDDELTLYCEDEFAREIEKKLKRQMYKWNHLRDDNIVFAEIEVPKIFSFNGYGIDVKQNILKTDSSNDVVSHKYADMIESEDDLARLHNPIVVYDEKATLENVEKTQDLVGDALKAKATGVTVSLQLWDHISILRGVEPILFDIMDKPDFVHKIIARFCDYTDKKIDMLEEQGLLEPAQNSIHCSGAWTDELPKEDFNPDKPRTYDAWTMGMAQMFSTISPAMHEEFEISHQKDIYERFGLVNYGCCEPLDRKIDMIRKINNIRKISISPWADERRSAEAIGGDYIYLRKPNPALLVGDFSDEKIRKHLKETLEICKQYGAMPEFILKDISTVEYKPKNLWRWAEIAREMFGG